MAAKSPLMMAAVGGLNSMARLPTDGKSVQSHSSGSIQSAPSLPAAPAAPSAENTADQNGDHDGAGTTDASAKPLVASVPDAGTTASILDAHETVAGRTGDQEGQEVENSTLVPPGEGASPSSDIAPTASQGSCPAVHPGLECGAVALNDGATEEEETEPTAEAAALVHDDGKPPDKPLQAFHANTPPSSAETGTAVETSPQPTALADTELDLVAENSKAVTTLAGPTTETNVETAEESSQALAAQGNESEGKATTPKIELVGGKCEVTIMPDHASETDATMAEEPGGGQAFASQGKENEGEISIPKSPPLKQDRTSDRETEGAQDSEANPGQEEKFFPSNSFTGAKLGYVFKTGDKGLGFYVEGYVDQPVRDKYMHSHRPWNAGPGELAIRRGPLGPIPKPFKKIVPFRTREETKAAQESDMRPFMARMVAQRNSRGFQSTLLGREHALDKHILHLLEKFSDPSFFKKKHGYNVHGQMLGKDGKMIVKVTPEKTDEEKAKLPWYRKVYEDRLGKHLPSKRLGDSIEARREAYAYSRHFTGELNHREEELNRALTKALKGQTKLEFITEDYHYPGGYDLHGKIILEKGAPVLNDLHRTAEQTERACTYRYKAIQRYRAAHEDIKSAIAKKDKALQKMLKHSDPATLMEISEEAVTSSGMGIYRQKKRAAEGSVSTAGPSPNQPTERPDQLRQKFAQSLKAEIKGKDKALLKEIAALEEDEADQMIGDFGKGAEVLPSSWRQDPETLKKMQRRRKQLIAENAADRRKVVCPWRPGGKHIAQEPWQPFTPRDHRPPARSASEGKAQAHKGGGTGTTQNGEGCGPRNGEKGVDRRPHTAPTHRRKAFMDEISPRARRVLAAQSPGTSLHSAFSTYSTDPFPVEARHRPRAQSAAPKSEYSTHGSPPLHTGFGSRTSNQGTAQRAWAEIPNSSTFTQQSRAGSSKRPHSAAAEMSRKLRHQPRRPATACGTRDSNGAATEDEPETHSGHSSPSPIQGDQHELDEPSRDLHVRGGPGVTVLWARLCAPSSDLIYKSSVWPKAPDASRPTRRRAKPPKKSVSTPVSTGNVPEAEAGHEQASPPPETEDSSPADAGVAQGRAGDNAGPAKDGCPLEDLEDSLFASSSQRVNQRRRVFRGYAERSRREKTWDPGSTFYAEGASKHHVSGPRLCNMRRKGGRGSGANGAPSVDTATKRKHQRDRRRVSADTHPVDVDWAKVDIERFDGGIKEIEAALGTRLFAVAAQSGQLDECFWEAQELVESAGILLGCPENEQERFRKQAGPITIGNYVAMVSRLNILWTAACGVVEIVQMIRRRRDLREVFCSEEGEQPCKEHAGTDSKMVADNTCQEHTSAPPAPVTGGESSQQRGVILYDKRLEIAELSIAIAESVKMWVSVVPWRVQVLYGGQLVLSTLRAEEEALPWPPDPGPLSDADDEKLGEAMMDGEQKPGRAQVGCETATTEMCSSIPCNGDEEGRTLEAGCVSQTTTAVC